MKLYKCFLLLPLLFLCGCAVPLKGSEMMAKSTVYDSLKAPSLERKLSLGNVTTEKNLGGVAPVIPEEYKVALELSLRQAGLYTPNDGAYVLDAHMLKIQQPFIGFDFTVKATAKYSLVRVKTGKVVYEEILTLPCTVRFAESLNGEIRLRKATACSVGENITHMLKVLSEDF